MHQCWSFLFIAVKMAIVSLIALYLVLTMMPYFVVEIVGHRISIDLSYPIDNNVMHWITHKDFEIKFENGTKNVGNGTFWYQSDQISFSTHTGTHLDAPIHFAKNKWTISDIPLWNLIERPLVIIDVIDQTDSIRDYAVTVNDIEQWEKVNHEIVEHSVVIFRTGWSRFWPNKLNYFGTDTKDVSLVHFPGLHHNTAKWLVQNRKVVGVGIDSPSIDCGQCGIQQGYPTHVVLSEANIYILENIAKSISKVPSVGATITVLPLNLVGASACPVRALAQYTHNHHDTNVATEPSASISAIIVMLALAIVCDRLH